MSAGEPLNSPVTLADYDPRWPELFETERATILSVLGARAPRIEHVGSTSVPGLCAKPVIDIVLAVADSSRESDYVPPLEAVGYQLRIRESEWYEHRLLKTPEVTVNLHVFPSGCSEIDRMLLFRDWLRANEADRRLYAETKMALARQRWEYMQDYADAKTEVVNQILKRAVAASRR